MKRYMKVLYKHFAKKKPFKDPETTQRKCTDSRQQTLNIVKCNSERGSSVAKTVIKLKHGTESNSQVLEKCVTQECSNPDS